MSEYRFMNQLTEKGQIPTPAYVFDLDEMKEFAEKVKRCLTGKAEICYAMKANPFLIKSMMEIVSSLEVCSPGEFRICERAGIPMEKIVPVSYTHLSICYYTNDCIRTNGGVC